MSAPLKIHRGDIVLCVVSGDYGKPRPALVLQADIYNETHASVIVLPITSHIVAAPFFRIDMEPDSTNGLDRPSQVMIDKVVAVKRERIREIIGRAAPALLVELETAFLRFIDLPLRESG